jgi:hypothetical protein
MALTEAETLFLTTTLAAIEATITKVITSGVASNGMGSRNWTALDLDKLEKMRQEYRDRLNGTGTIYTNHAIIL